MRTSKYLATVVPSLVITASAFAGGANDAQQQDPGARDEIQREMSDFICGTPEKEVPDDVQNQPGTNLPDIDADQSIATGVVGEAAVAGVALASAVDVDTNPDSEPTEDQPKIATDLTGDGVVDLDDVLLVLQSWGSCHPFSLTPCFGDVNSDGYVDQHDLLLLLADWG